MIFDARKLVDSYIEWLKTEIDVSISGDISIITTPFLDQHNDQLQILIKQDDEGYYLTDDGYTLNDLELSGLKFNSSLRKMELRKILMNYGVENNEDELFVKCNSKNFPQRKHNLLQAMIAISDLYHIAQEKVQNLFFDDVEKFLTKHDIRFSSNVSFMGYSGIEQKFDFVIPKSTKEKERVIKAINYPSRVQTATSYIFSLMDVDKTRQRDLRSIAFLNDLNAKPSDETLHALKQYEITPVEWTKRDEYLGLLAA